MMRGQDRKGRAKAAVPLALLVLPLLAFPLLSACADKAETRPPCEQPSSCPKKRPLPILY
jgi:hypothetical protein